ncbi:hypothetical protein PHJA_001146400 [Phtheirospermum japonicum]|uniref:RING-type domain-containing protein n=1 Tax=Phtheirospermum japonicum TaxID=374723 RepID=A0A830BTA8_9LAMI|nr:hypothetical protein PHJA_001146400 [Phtheirospermum japonicum]
MTGANSIDVKNDKSEFNRETDIAYPDGNDNVTADCSMRFMLPWCEPAAGYPIKSHGAEAKTSRISSNRSPILGSFGVMGNNNDNDITVFPRPYISPRDVNGDFLSLGIGGGAEIKSNSNFSTREIASKLGDPVPVSSQCKSSIVGQSPTNTWNLDPFTGLASGVQTNGGGLSSPALPGSSRLNPIQFPGLEAHQAKPPFDNFVIDLTQPSSSSPSGIPVIPQRGCVVQSPMGPQISRPTSLASQRQQQYSRRSYVNASSESFRNNLSDSFNGSSISHAQLGTLTPLTEARQSVAGGRFPGGVRYRGSVQPLVHSGASRNLGPVAVPGNSSFPRSFALPIPRGSTIQSAAAVPFPRRLGVQQNEPTVRTIGGIPDQAYPIRPLLESGQHHHGMPAQLPMDFPRVDYSSGQFTPVAKYGVRPPGPFVSHPHLKRQATENPSTALVSQRFDEPLEPSGHKCLLCKRDISFTAEGQVYQPAIPPAVAVLACGHTFHEDCLQRITPEDYSIDPPCIPCALGDT